MFGITDMTVLAAGSDGMSEHEYVVNEDTYTHVFAYRISKEKHEALLGVLEGVSDVLKRHGMSHSRVYQLGTTSVFRGFEVFDKALGASDGEEVWLETDYYPSKAEFELTMAKLPQDKEVQALFGELRQITVGRPIIMGEFSQLLAMG
jgi:uncharacterized protein YbaA (DUF1428 family)